MQKGRKLKKEAIKKYSDDDILDIFVAGKSRNAEGNKLRMQEGPLKYPIIFFKGKDEKWTEYARIARIESAVGGTKKVLVINPRLGNEMMIRRMFGGFNPERVYWSYKLIPINLDKALSINRDEHDKGTLLAGSTKLPDVSGAVESVGTDKAKTV